MAGKEPNQYERELTTDLNDATPDRPRGMALHNRIFIGLAVGAGAGLAFNAALGPNHPTILWTTHNLTEPIGTLFLRLLLMIVVPLIFSALVVGVAGVGDVRKLGRVGLKSFAYTIIFSAISVLIGLTLANTIRPGHRINPETTAALNQRYGTEATQRMQAAGDGASESPLMQVVRTIVPANPIAAVASETPNLLHLMFFAAFLGVAVTLIPVAVSKPMLDVLQAVFDASAKAVDIIMRLAPYAVACLVFNSTSRFGLDLLGALVWFIATVLLGLGLQMFGVYSLSVYFLSKISPVEFFRRTKTVAITAFSTSSSNATLPTAMRVSEENLGVPREINSFVLTVGATMNQNGTALYEGITVLFLAQLAGLQLSLGSQLMVVYLAILGGIGTAGIPSGSIPFIVAILAQMG
ncbi:MAG: dicarboxylate/amino acid:cation symporter, partial [Candidatus Korobacteraceae bacterium]